MSQPAEAYLAILQQERSTVSPPLSLVVRLHQVLEDGVLGNDARCAARRNAVDSLKHQFEGVGRVRALLGSGAVGGAEV